MANIAAGLACLDIQAGFRHYSQLASRVRIVEGLNVGMLT